MHEIRTLELLPLGHDHQCIGTGERLVLRAGEMQTRKLLRHVSQIEPEDATCFVDRDRIIRAHGRAAGKQVRNHAIMLLEATNLLQIPGRHVAKSGEKANDPNVELSPEQIEDSINKSRTAFVTAGIIALRGGAPVRVNGAVVGAVGVAGLSKETDADIANTAAAALSPAPKGSQQN